MLTDRPTRRDEHQVKWIQAERELIIKGVIIPRLSINSQKHGLYKRTACPAPPQRIKPSAPPSYTFI